MSCGDSICLRSFSAESLEEPLDHGIPLTRLPQFVFPYANHTDPLGPQGAVYLSRPRNVSIDFLAPVPAIILREPETMRASMPKTAIDEHGQPMAREPEIWNPCDLLGVEFPPPNSRTRKRHA